MKRPCAEHFQKYYNEEAKACDAENSTEEHSSTLHKKQRKDEPLLEDIFDHYRYQIRRIVHSFFMRREQPTLDSIQVVIKKNKQIPVLPNCYLIKLLHKINFRLRGRRHTRFLKERDQTIIWRRRYLKQIKEYRQERPVYYLDETFTYVHQDSAVKSFTIFHIGNENGFLDDGLLIFETKTPEDYNQKFKITVYEDWFRRVLPKLQDGAVVILHHAPCTSRTLDQFPTMATHKVDIKKWLLSKGVVFEPDMVKLELLNLARRAKPLTKPYIVDEIAKTNNIITLRMPPYHNELSPLQRLWPGIKSEVTRKCSSCNFEEVCVRLFDAIARVSKDDWKAAIEYVQNVEKELWQLDFIMEQHMEPLLVNNCSSNESESDSE